MGPLLSRKRWSVIYRPYLLSEIIIVYDKFKSFCFDESSWSPF